jgi:hypothetical protein
MKETDHDILCSTYKEGLLLEEGCDIYEQIDSVIRQYSSNKFSLVSLEKVIPVDELHLVDIIVSSGNLVVTHLQKLTAVSRQLMWLKIC